MAADDGAADTASVVPELDEGRSRSEERLKNLVSTTLKLKQIKF